jgi:hypothetical protein
MLRGEAAGAEHFDANLRHPSGQLSAHRLGDGGIDLSGAVALFDPFRPHHREPGCFLFRLGSQQPLRSGTLPGCRFVAEIVKGAGEENAEGLLTPPNLVNWPLNPSSRACRMINPALGGTRASLVSKS